jgi:hypothetical protein
MLYAIVVLRARRWTYRLTYEIRGEEVQVLYLYPSWYPLTHPDIVAIPDDDD